MSVLRSSLSTATGVTFADPYAAGVTLVTFAVLALLVSAAGALTYRWYFRTEIPDGVTVLLGVAIVALYLNTTSLGELAGGTDAALLTPEGVFFNVVALGLAAAVTPVGRYAGDRIAVDVFALTGLKDFEGELSRVVRTVGRYTAVTLPAAEEIGDMDTYEPVSTEKKAELAGKTLLFPRRLTVEELRAQLVDRIKTDYGVGYVDVDLTEDGALEYFAVGSRATGLGPTLAPGRVAIALSADPPNNATPGDMVQVWRTDPEPKRVATGELRGVADDVATLVIDEADAAKFSVEGGYRLVTLPAEPQADREFASLLRYADETLAIVAVQPGSSLVGTAVGEVSAVVAAVKSVDGEVQPIPPRAYRFAADDTVYLVGRPDAIRRFEADAESKVDDEPTDAADPHADADPSPDGEQSSSETNSDGATTDEGLDVADPDGSNATTEGADDATRSGSDRR